MKDINVLLIQELPARLQKKAKDLFALLDVPPEARGLRIVMKVFDELVNHLVTSSIATIAAFGAEWQSVTREIRSLLESLANEYPSLDIRSTQGFCSDNPIYAALLSYPFAHGMAKVRLHVLGFIVFCLETQRGTLSSGQRYESCLAFRKFFRSADIGLMTHLTAASETPQQLAREMQGLIDPDGEFAFLMANEHTKNLIRLFKGDMYAGSPRKNKHTRQGGPRFTSELTRRDTVEVVSDSRSGTAARKIISIHSGVSRDDEAAVPDIESGMAVRETLEVQYAEDISTETDNPKLDRDRMQQAIRSRTLNHQIARANQHLVDQTNELTPFEFYLLFRELMLLPVSDVTCPIPATALAAQITVMLCGSVPLDSVTDFRWAARNRDDTTQHIALWKKGGEWQGQIHRATLIPRQEAVLYYPGWEEGTRKINPQLVLPLPVWAADILGHWREKQNLTRWHQSKLFDWDTMLVQKAIRNWLRSLRRKYKGARITVSRVEKYFLQRAIQERDIHRLEAAIMFERKLHSIATPLHYSALGTPLIQEKYRNLCQQLEREVETERIAQMEESFFRLFEVDQMTLLVSVNTNESDPHAGSQLVPLRHDARALVNGLAEAVQLGSERYREHGDIVRFHNIYTLYCVVYFLWASGWRATRCLVPDIRLLDLESGCLYISDKDQPNGARTRLVWLPQDCLLQMNYYFQHLDALNSHLLAINPALSDEARQLLDRAMQPHHQLARVARRIEKRDQSPFFFLSGDKDHLRVVSTTEVKKRIAYLFPHLDNTHRQYMRTDLFTAGLDEAFLEAWMGHAVCGRESYAPFSTMSLRQYRIQSTNKVEQVLSGLGWQSIRSVIT